MTAWLTSTEAADRARVSLRTFRRWVRSGHMPEGRCVAGGRRVWSPDEIDAAIRGERSSGDPILERIRKAMEGV